MFFIFTLHSGKNEGQLYVIQAFDEDDAWTQFETIIAKQQAGYKIVRNFAYNNGDDQGLSVTIGDFLIPELYEEPDVDCSGQTRHCHQILMTEGRYDENIRNAVCW